MSGKTGQSAGAIWSDIYSSTYFYFNLFLNYSTLIIRLRSDVFLAATYFIYKYVFQPGPVEH